MCGIIGFFRMGPKAEPLDLEDVIGGFIECSTRGTGATGFYSPDTGTIKDGTKAVEFCESHRGDIEKAIKGGVLIGHCRAASNGFRGTYATPARNDNNHPHEGERYVLVHNGIYTDAPEVKDYKYKGECDSELALSYIETFGLKAGIELMSKHDSFSLVIFDKKTENLYLYRHSNPLVVGTSKSGLFMFASTSLILVSMAAEKTIYGFNVCDSTPFINTRENHLYHIVPGRGLIENTEIKLADSPWILKGMKNGAKLDFDRWEESKYPAVKRYRDSKRERHITVPSRRDETDHKTLPSNIEDVFIGLVAGRISFSSPVTMTKPLIATA